RRRRRARDTNQGVQARCAGSGGTMGGTKSEGGGDARSQDERHNRREDRGGSREPAEFTEARLVPSQESRSHLPCVSAFGVSTPQLEDGKLGPPVPVEACRNLLLAAAL